MLMLGSPTVDAEAIVPFAFFFLGEKREGPEDAVDYAGEGRLLDLAKDTHR